MQAFIILLQLMAVAVGGIATGVGVQKIINHGTVVQQNEREFVQKNIQQNSDLKPHAVEANTKNTGNPQTNESPKRNTETQTPNTEQRTVKKENQKLVLNELRIQSPNQATRQRESLTPNEYSINTQDSFDNIQENGSKETNLEGVVTKDYAWENNNGFHAFEDDEFYDEYEANKKYRTWHQDQVRQDDWFEDE